MESDPTPWLAWREIADLATWAVLAAVVLLYLWALTVGPVSAVDPAPRTAPVPTLKPVHPAPDGAALV